MWTLTPGRHRLVEAEVGHHRHHDRFAGEQPSAGQVGGEQGDKAVAVHQVAPGVDGDDPVGVPIEGQPEVRPFSDNRLGQLPGVGRAAPVVDVRAVGLDGQDGDELGTSRLEHCGGALESGPVGAVERHPQAP